MRSYTTIIAIVCIAFSLNTEAQNLPNKQETSILAPAVIKIDGKLDEWNDKLQAYNTATDVYYTLSNDDKNLYLALKTKEYFVMENILKNGIRFTINHSISKG